MYETPEDLAKLDQVLERSVERASDSMRRAFNMPRRSMTASRLAHHWQGVVTAVMATVSSQGEPRTAPVGLLLYRGAFHVPTTRGSLRYRHLARNPALSLTAYSDGFALIVHGRGVPVSPGEAGFTELEAIQHATRHTRVSEWDDGVFIRIEADLVFTHDRSIDNPVDQR